MRQFRVLFVSGITRLLCSECYQVAREKTAFFACGVEVVSFPNPAVIQIQEVRPSHVMKHDPLEVALPFMIHGDRPVQLAQRYRDGVPSFLP